MLGHGCSKQHLHSSRSGSNQIPCLLGQGRANSPVQILLTCIHKYEHYDTVRLDRQHSLDNAMLFKRRHYVDAFSVIKETPGSLGA